MNNKQVSI